MQETLTNITVYIESAHLRDSSYSTMQMVKHNRFLKCYHSLVMFSFLVFCLISSPGSLCQCSGYLLVYIPCFHMLQIM